MKRILLALLPPMALCVRLALSAPPSNPELDALSAAAFAHYSAGEHAKALRVFEEGGRLAESLGSIDRAVGFWNGVGGSCHAIGNYRGALSAYNHALEIASRAQLTDFVGPLSINISSLYLLMGDPDAAELVIEPATRTLPPTSKYYPQLFFQRGAVWARRGDLIRAEQVIAEGIERASLAGQETEAVGWEKLGWILVVQKRLDGADAAFTEAFRLARMQKRTVPPAVYQGLARVRLLNQDYRSARNLLDEALRLVRSGTGRTPFWHLYHLRGRVSELSGRVTEALSDYRAALRYARLWRSEILPAAWMQTASDVGLSTVVSDFVALAMNQASREPGLAVEAFFEAEDSKANSLRFLALQAARVPAARRAEYGELLARLSDELFRSLRTTEVVESPGVRSLRARLAQLESETMADEAFTTTTALSRPAEARLKQLQARLSDADALLVFYAQEPESVVWVLTRQTFRYATLPGREELHSARRREFGTEGRRPVALGVDSFSSLITRVLPKDVLTKSRWWLSLDGPFVEVPWPAVRILSVDRSSRTRFLVEEQTLEVLPSALFLPAASAARPWREGRLVGIADAIYNRADPRWTSNAGQGGIGLVPPFEFNRLKASGEELEKVAGATSTWLPQQNLFSGDQATLAKVADALSRPASVVHFATHVFSSTQRGSSVLFSPELESSTLPTSVQRKPAEVLIALSMEGDGRINFLSTSEIISRGFQLPSTLVVLNGCGSGTGDQLPGAGVMNLARSWLAAGARAVVVSHWPTADEDGTFFAEFYRDLGSRRETGAAGAAGALATAQRAMVRRGGWRGNASFWAAYFVVGRD